MDLYPQIATLTIHVLAGVFWAGSTFAMVNLGSADAAGLFPFQMGSAAVTILAGLALWWFRLGSDGGHRGRHAIHFVDRVRSALAAASPEDESAIIGTMTKGNRGAASLLMITVASMMIARFY